MLNEITGIVIDTNVLVHSTNEEINYFESSCSILNLILNSELPMFVDDEYHPDEAKNTSRISSEYTKHVRAGTLAYTFLISMAQNGRISQIQEKIYSKHKKLFKQMVRNKNDIIFLAVTMCTPEKFLLSNDFEDFTTDKRNVWRKSHCLNIFDSIEVLKTTPS